MEEIGLALLCVGRGATLMGTSYKWRSLVVKAPLEGDDAAIKQTSICDAQFTQFDHFRTYILYTT